MGRIGQVAWNKGLLGYSKGVPRHFKVKPIPWNKGLTKDSDPKMELTALRMKEAHLRKRIENGDTSGVGGKHDRLRRKYGKKKVCENCGTTEAKYFDWASLDHKYDSDNTESWARLCRKCHSHYDMVKIKVKGLLLTET